MVIVEVDINVAKVPVPRLDRLAPGRKGSSRVATFVSAARAMATQIDEVGGAFPWRWRIMVVGNAERDVSIGQNSKNVCRVPTGMTEFKAVSAPLRKEFQESTEPACVGREIRRQLNRIGPTL